MGDLGSVPGLGRSPGEGDDCPLQYFWLENGLQSWDHKESDMPEWLTLSLFFLFSVQFTTETTLTKIMVSFQSSDDIE